MPAKDSAWNAGAEEFDGVTFVDKSTLKGVPLVITDVVFGNDGYPFVELDIKTADRVATIRDASGPRSNGIMSQMSNHFENLGKTPEIGEVVSVNISVPGGLSSSTFVRDDGTEATVYRLTTTGKRRR